MKVLVFSVSPYSNTVLGKMCSSVISGLAAQGHEVEIAAWDHNTEYYLPDKDRKYYFEINENKYLLHAIDSLSEKTSVDLFEIIKLCEPDVVVSVGDYWDTAVICPIKAMQPKMFSWVSILTTGRLPVELSFKDALDYADEIITTTKEGAKLISEQTPTTVTYVPYGYNQDVFRPYDKKPGLSIIANLQNSMISNIPAYLMALSKLKHHFGVSFSSYLHTNLDDVGEYNIKSLIKEFNIEDVIDLPEQFVSNWYDEPEAELKLKYQSSLVVVDPSIYASTGLHVLEAMASGCIPLVTKTGAFSEIISNDSCFISSNTLIGDRHHRSKIISSFNLASKLKKVNDWNIEKKSFMRSKSIENSKRFTANRFVIDVSKIVGRAISALPALAVDVLT